MTRWNSSQRAAFNEKTELIAGKKNNEPRPVSRADVERAELNSGARAMSSETQVVGWRESRLGRWHAWKSGEQVSVCGKVHERHTQTDAEDISDDDQRLRCSHCRRRLGIEPKRVDAPPMRAPEEMVVEFIGGPYDGNRVTLVVLRTDATRLRVLSTAYRFVEREPEPSFD